MKAEDKMNMEAFEIITLAIAAESNSLEAMVNHLTQLLVGALDIKGCSMFLLDKESNELERVATFGLSLAFVDKGPVMAGESVARDMKGETVIIRDVSQDNQLQYPKETLREGIGAIVSVPIIYLKEIIGVLRLYHRQGWDISEKDLDAIRILAGLIGVAVMHTRYLNGLQSIAETLGDYPQDWITPRKI